eukprot:6193324-Pleurochrysis_carterae.AAC.3
MQLLPANIFAACGAGLVWSTCVCFLLPNGCTKCLHMCASLPYAVCLRPSMCRRPASCHSERLNLHEATTFVPCFRVLAARVLPDCLTQYLRTNAARPWLPSTNGLPRSLIARLALQQVSSPTHIAVDGQARAAELGFASSD